MRSEFCGGDPSKIVTPKEIQEKKNQIESALKLQELVKEIFKYGLPISLKECGESMVKIQSLLEAAKK